MNNNLEQKKSPLPIIALILAIVGFFFSPFCVVNGVAVGFAIACLIKKFSKGLSIAALCVGIASLLWQVVADLFTIIITMGIGFFVIFF